MTLIEFDFPREVLDMNESGQGYRKLVNTKEELQNYWKGKNGISNAYVTQYGYRATTPPKHHRCDYTTPIIRHFVMDFDCKDFSSAKKNEIDIDNVLEQVRNLHTHLLDASIQHGVWFSGGGFHCWVKLQEPHIPSSPSHLSAIREAGMKVVNGWINTLKLFSCDPTVPFNTSGMIRIPNSYNSKRGLWSIPLSTEELFEKEGMELLALATNARKGYKMYGDVGITLDVRRKPSSNSPTFDSSTPAIDLPTSNFGTIKILPCLNAAACQVGSNPTHVARKELVIYLGQRLRNFFPWESTTEEQRNKHIEQICEFINTLQWEDYNEGVTRYQVRSILSKPYMQTCKRLYNTEGLCMGKCQLWDGTGGIR
jgi:hypothetical protein